MNLIINIPDEVYKATQVIKPKHDDVIQIPLEVIANGTPLPKGHGRLIDANELKKEYPHDTDWDYPVNTNCYVVESIDNSPTIIEADMGE